MSRFFYFFLPPGAFFSDVRVSGAGFPNDGSRPSSVAGMMLISLRSTD
jgi:hypothetical protein